MTKPEDTVIVENDSPESINEANAAQEKIDKDNAFTADEAADEQQDLRRSSIRDATPEEVREQMSRPVEYDDNYVAPSKDHAYNPGSYTILGDKYYDKSPDGETYREDVRERAEEFQQTPVFQSLEATSGYKLQLQSQAWDAAPKYTRGAKSGLIKGDFPMWDTNNFFGDMAKNAPKKKDSMLYGMSNGIRYAIPGATGKKTGKNASKEDHPFAINLLGGFGIYETGKNTVKNKAAGLGFPTGFVNPFATSTSGDPSFRKGDRKIKLVKQSNGIFEPTADSTYKIFSAKDDKDKYGKQQKALKGMRGTYRNSSDEPREYNPGNYSILGANYATSASRRKEVEKDAGAFAQTIAYSDLVKQHSERLETQSHAFTLGGSKVVDTDSMDAVYARESQVGRILVDGVDRLGTRIPNGKVKKTEQLHYTPLGNNYFTSKSAAGKVQAKAKLFQKSKEYSDAEYRNDRTLLDQSKKWSLVPKQGRPPIDPRAEGYALSGDDKGKVPKNEEGYGGIPYIIPAALFANSKKKPLSTPMDDGSGARAKQDPQNVGVVGKGQKKTPPTSSGGVKKSKYHTITPEEYAYFPNGVPSKITHGQFTESKQKHFASLAAFDRETERAKKAKLDDMFGIAKSGFADLEVERKKNTAKQEEVQKENQKWADWDVDAIKKQNRSISDETAKAASRKLIKETKLQKERDDKVFGGTLSYVSKKDQTMYGVRNYDRELKKDIDKKNVAFEDRLVNAFGVEKLHETQRKENEKWVAKRQVARIKQSTASAKRESDYNKNTTPGQKLTDAIFANESFGKGSKPWNYNPKHGVGRFEREPSWDQSTGKRGAYENTGYMKRSATFNETHPGLSQLGANAKANVKKPFVDLLQGQKDRAASYDGKNSWFYGAGRQRTSEKKFPTAGAHRYGQQRSPYAGSQVASFFGSMPFGMPKPTSVKMTRRTKSTGKLVLTAAGRKAQSAAKRRAKKKGNNGGFLGDLFGGGGWL